MNIEVKKKALYVKYMKDSDSTASLTNTDIDTPNISDMAGDAQPGSYVPFRNLMFLSICSSYAEGVGADTVWYGAAQVDSLAGYWDGSEEFVNNVNTVTELNRENRIKIEAPLLDMSKADIVKEGIRLGVKYKDTWTCYSEGRVEKNGKGYHLIADATTPSSSMRVKGFVDAGYKDPITYLQQDKLNKLYEENNCRECA